MGSKPVIFGQNRTNWSFSVKTGQNGHFRSKRSFSYNFEIFFLSVGFVGQGLFASRFIVQWIYSERINESSIPLSFWYLSIFGGIGLLTYAIFRQDPVIIVGQSFGIFVYARNLILIAFLIHGRNALDFGRWSSPV